jgi:peptidoglycan/LPS O-acetylase OafA/YrhL
MFKSFLVHLIKEYRPELNGLRALAVILVLLYHLDFQWMKGGFLGVDVFLVISGYFISKNILFGLQKRTFAFTGFYTKRLRRLFPALIFTLIVVLLAGYFLLTPSNYERLGQSSIFASLSASNFFFWNESGYFNLDASTKPLLHMWSLSLEEQFYLFWPLLLVILYKYFRKYLILFISLLILGSLVLSEIYFTSHPDASFFLIPFRMFEFLLGAACIWLETIIKNKPKLFLELLFVAGLALILYSGMQFDSSSRMPGLLSLVPCIGSVFIIMGGKAPILSWTLKNKPVELIGKASYSIYLIHWPLIVYYKYWTLVELTLTTKVVLGVISVVLGLLMWHFIENTFRFRKSKKTKMDPIWLAIPVLILGVSVMSAMVWKSEGVPSRFSDEVYMTKEEILINRKAYWKESNSKNTVLKGEEGKGHVIVLGNSHAIDLIYALRSGGLKSKITSLQTSGKCYNFGIAEKEIDREFCATKRQRNLENINWQVADAIYLHDDWPQWESEGFREILKVIRMLTEAPVFVFGPKMTYTEQVPEIISSSNSINPKIINERAKEFALKDIKVNINDKLLDEFKRPYYSANSIHYVDLLTLQGGENMDSFEVVSKDNLKFLYFDASHLTAQGSKELGEKIKNVYPHLFDIDSLK